MSAADIGVADWADIVRKPPGWVIVDPRGRVEGLLGWRDKLRATAEQAHATFTPNAHRRAEEIRNGWVVRREQPGDREALAEAVAE